MLEIEHNLLCGHLGCSQNKVSHIHEGLNTTFAKLKFSFELHKMDNFQKFYRMMLVFLSNTEFSIFLNLYTTHYNHNFGGQKLKCIH